MKMKIVTLETGEKEMLLYSDRDCLHYCHTIIYINEESRKCI
jgi:hypothetical protein